MENYYLIFIIFLFILAIADLVVGVSNDAVNFLNSAIGSHAAKRTTIMTIAALGVFIGAAFSSGMMEVARKGIFNPEYFSFADIMTIYMAVMLTDIILLDGFNRLGFPTSTTVSIVFEILGGALALAVIKTYTGTNPELHLGDYINSSKALGIISGILLSVIIAFSSGVIVQWIIRYAFTFNFDAKIKYFGSIYGGIAITAITYFMLIKGAKDASFMSKEMQTFIQVNSFHILIYCFIGWTILTQILVWLFKINILKVIVLFGTFALAMAFAGNDLVNFIGVPLAGLSSFDIFIHAPAGTDPTTFIMTGLSGKVHTPTYLLILAGLIMVVTLWFSKKARLVVDTGINLSRQDVTEERFESSVLARGVVRGSRNFGTALSGFIPQKIKLKIQKRFDTAEYTKRTQEMKNPPAFDLIRASVNLILASVLISFATSLKLPLSTTYVTFMVAMGTSLSDKAWGRESAVFRITGVFTVIGGWFLTAFIALSVAFVFTNIIYVGGLWAVVIMFGIATYFFIKKSKKKDGKDEIFVESEDRVLRYKNRITRKLNQMREKLISITIALCDEDRKELDKLTRETEELSAKVKSHKDRMYQAVKGMNEETLEIGLFHVQTLDFLRESAHAIHHISTACLTHIANNHKPLIEEQKEDLKKISISVNAFMERAVEMLDNNDFSEIEKFKDEQTELLEEINNSTKNQVKRLKLSQGHTRASVLFLNYMQETKNIVLQTLNVIKLQRDANDCLTCQK